MVSTQHTAVIRALAALAWAVAVALAVAGCATPEERAPEVSRVATGFLRAVRDGDGARACAVLAPWTRQELRGSAKAPCAEAVLAELSPAPGDVAAAGRVDIYGQQARVRTPGPSGTLFLGHFTAGWKVTAAGCQPRPAGLPYACTLQGS